jgi:hypothetical protein
VFLTFSEERIEIIQVRTAVMTEEIIELHLINHFSDCSLDYGYLKRILAFTARLSAYDGTALPGRSGLKRTENR